MLDGKDILSISYLRYLHIGILSNEDYKYPKPTMLRGLLSLNIYKCKVGR